MDRDERERRRDSFLGDAEDYFAARPGYPDEVLEAAVSLGSLEPGDSLLEVGCGTGEVTQWFVSRGFSVRALDRSADMIRLARRRLQDVGPVTLEVRDFEDLTPRSSLAAVILATAYHWLEPQSRASRCAEWLEPGGSLILLWHTHPRPFTGYHACCQSIYRAVVPGWEPPASPGMSEDRIEGVVSELESCGAFASIARRSHVWERTYDRDLYLRLLSTYSDHRLLAEAQRHVLFERLGSLFDGMVVRPYRTELIVARRS